MRLLGYFTGLNPEPALNVNTHALTLVPPPQQSMLAKVLPLNLPVFKLSARWNRPLTRGLGAVARAKKVAAETRRAVSALRAVAF
jgi:hypothetical protein